MMKLIRAGAVVTASELGQLDDAGIAIEDRVITRVAPWRELEHLCAGAQIIDARDLVVSPGLIDSHTHNLEFGGFTTWSVGESAQMAGGVALVFDALRAGVTALGEHIVGHLKFRREFGDYIELTKLLPQTIRFSVGGCVIGVDPMACLCAVRGPGTVALSELLDSGNLAAMAALNQFPGENLMVTATPANLPASATPLAGTLPFTQSEIDRIVGAYHDAGSAAGGHVQGDDGARMLLASGADVMHHGHGVTPPVWTEMAKAGMKLCATPGGGTALAPNTPEEILGAIDAGVEVSIATDAVLPLHPESTSRVRDESLIFSSDLISLATPAIEQLTQRGVSASDAIRLITINAARLLGIDTDLGSIEPGKQADLVFTTGIIGVDVKDADGVFGVFIAGDAVCGDIAALR